MQIDTEKIDNMTLALLYLVLWDEKKHGLRAWKGFDWSTLNRLYEKGFLSNPKGKSKSVSITPKGYKRSKELFEEHFINLDNDKDE